MTYSQTNLLQFCMLRGYTRAAWLIDQRLVPRGLV